MLIAVLFIGAAFQRLVVIQAFLFNVIHANKKLKTLLTMAAICAVRFDPGLKAKYHQKVGAGKPKMSVLNIIRAKRMERIFTVVKRGYPYAIRLAA
jgi:hypothetical protein